MENKTFQECEERKGRENNNLEKMTTEIRLNKSTKPDREKTSEKKVSRILERKGRNKNNLEKMTFEIKLYKNKT